MNNELIPCPFCGGEARLIAIDFADGDTWYRPECSRCKCGWQENYETEDEATNAWNGRNDMVEVVRCKDCKYFISQICRFDFAMNLCCEDDFCSYGKRKDNIE